MNRVNRDEFKKYGHFLTGFDFSNSAVQFVPESAYAIPESGNRYTASVPDLERLPVFQWLKESVYGGLEIQLGVCAGHNQVTTALEYHIGSEVVIALKDCLLPLGLKKDMKGNYYHAQNMETFLLKKGEAVELFDTTLHYSPLECDTTGYATLVALLKGTNTPLDKKGDNPLLLAKNKFMIVHSSREDKLLEGAFAGFIHPALEHKKAN